MINNTIDKTIDVLDALVNKTTNLKSKINENSITSDEYINLTEKLDTLSGLLAEPIDPSIGAFCLVQNAEDIFNGYYYLSENETNSYYPNYPVYINNNGCKLFIYPNNNNIPYCYLSTGQITTNYQSARYKWGPGTYDNLKNGSLSPNKWQYINPSSGSISNIDITVTIL